MTNLTDIIPTNALTGKAYQGGNIEILLEAMDQGGFTDPRFVTYKQALEMGRVVDKGQKAAARIGRVVKVIKEDKKGKDSKERPVMKTFCVFNIEQTRELSAEDKAA